MFFLCGVSLYGYRLPHVPAHYPSHFSTNFFPPQSISETETLLTQEATSASIGLRFMSDMTTRQQIFDLETERVDGAN